MYSCKWFAGFRVLIYGWLLCAIAPFLPHSFAAAQAKNAAVQNPPKIIEGCFTETIAKLGAPCEYWVRIGDSDDYNVVPSGTAGVTTTAHLVHFDHTRIEAKLTSVMNKNSPYGDPRNYTGTIKGNQIDGGVVQMIPGAKYNPKPIPWTGWIFYPPSNAARSSQAAFVACSSKMSAVNLGDHSVVTTDLKLNQFQPPQSMTVSADGKTAWASTNGQTANWYPAKLLVVDATAGLTHTFDLKTSMPVGFVSLAVAGDSVTLYGSAQTADGTTSQVVAMDATTAAVLAKTPYQPKDRAHWNAALVMAGNRVVLGDGSVPNLPAPKGGVAVFGSDGKGLSAFPDGQRLCVNGKTVSIDRPDSAAAKEPCSALAGGSTLIAPGPIGRTGPANLFGRFRTADEMLPGTKGVTPDGKSVFVTFPPNSASLFGTDKLVVADSSTNLIIDIVPVCDQPTLLAMPPFTR